MQLEARINSRRADQRLTALGGIDLLPVYRAVGLHFANTLRPITRVDTGMLQNSVGSQQRFDRVVSGYGVRLRESIPKMLASWNNERFVQAQRTADLEGVAEAEIDRLIEGL